jgi:2-dehydro-3-deoxyphosphogluconate aldolase / (4S)-4-hydroxy-2-oxoglutarate aldolase
MPNWTPESRSARVDEILSRAPILPVLGIERIDDAIPLARSLVEAGLPVLEITLRSAVAIEAIRRIAAEVPGALVGAGTVLDAASLRAVADAGALFAIAPGATEALYAAAADSAIPFLPAVATASELMRGLEHGHHRFKFFPAASSGGVDALRAFSGPFSRVRFCPTGGIDALSAPAYLALANVVTVGGSWMVPRSALEARDWDTIARLSRTCVNLARGR